MSSEDIVKGYIPIVDFLAEACGPSTEVVLHDIRNSEHSIVAIRNAHISERKGDEGLSDLAHQLIKLGERKGKRYIANYFSKSSKSGRTVRSSTYFIRDKDKNLIGMLGLNMDLTAISDAQRALEALLSIGSEGSDGGGNGNGARSDTSDLSVDEMVRGVMEQTIEASGVEPSRMTMDEKKSVVEELNAKGVFLLKGTVSEVAQRLDVSEQTIYRYLKNL